IRAAWFVAVKSLVSSAAHRAEQAGFRLLARGEERSRMRPASTHRMSLAPVVVQLREPAAWHFQSRSRGRTRGGFSSALLLRRHIITNEIKSRNLRMIACVRLALVSLPPSDDAAHGSLLSPEIDPTKQTRRRVRPNSHLNGHPIDYGSDRTPGKRPSLRSSGYQFGLQTHSQRRLRAAYRPRRAHRRRDRSDDADTLR